MDKEKQEQIKALIQERKRLKKSSALDSMINDIEEQITQLRNEIRNEYIKEHKY